jgi:PEP-CTERM motif
MKLKAPNLLKSVLLCAFAFASSGASAANLVYVFNLPATGLGSVNPPYPTVAKLIATDIAGGVQFDLVPNETSPGVNGNPANSFINDVQIVYSGSLTGTLGFTNVSGASVLDAFVGKNANMDAGYKSDTGYIQVDWTSPKVANLDFTQTSVWDISGISVSDLNNTYASANNKPSPTDGVIDVTAYALKSLNPTPSNWVTSPVPEPSTYAMLLAGLGLIGFIAYRRKYNSSNMPLAA